VDAELTAGNWISETWERWGFVVLLAAPFLVNHDRGDELQYRAVDDPHYWKAEYTCPVHDQAVACRFARRGPE
jgi:hypothetical protein